MRTPPAFAILSISNSKTESFALPSKLKSMAGQCLRTSPYFGSVMSVSVVYKVIGTTSDSLLACGSYSGTNGFLRCNAVDNTLDNSYSYNCYKLILYGA